MYTQQKNQFDDNTDEFEWCSTPLSILSILSLIISTIVFAYDAPTSRATVLYSVMRQTSDSLLKLKTDTLCFPQKLDGLLNVTDAINQSCPEQQIKNWKGPYTTQKDIDVTILSKDLSLSLYHKKELNSNSSANIWILRTSGLPNELQKEWLDTCNKLTKPENCIQEPDHQVGLQITQSAH